MAITERVILTVNGNVDEWKEPLQFMLETLKAQDGHLRTRWGPHSEDQQKLELLIGWESIESPTKFQASPVFQELLAKTTPILAAPPNIMIVEFKPYAPKEVIDAHFVQMLTIEQDTSSEDELRAQVSKFKEFEGCTGVASGLSHGDADGKGKVFVAAIGWDSLEASGKARESTVGFFDGAESHHVKF